MENKEKLKDKLFNIKQGYSFISQSDNVERERFCSSDGHFEVQKAPRLGNNEEVVFDIVEG